MHPEGTTDNNLAASNLVLIWFCRCWAAASPGKPNRPAFSLGKTSPVLPGRSTEREFAAFLGPRNSVAGDRCGDAVGFSTLRKAAMQTDADKPKERE